MYTASGIRSAEKAENHAKKKTKIYKESSPEKRAEYLEKIAKIPKENLVYIDESGIDEYIYREYGRAPVGKKVYGKVSGKKFKRTNIVAGYCGNKPIAPLIYDGVTDSAIFESWFEQFLLKEVSAGQTIVLDNASFHRKNILSKLAENAGVFVLFLPPYSPDLNPIEHFWANIKKKLRKILPCFDSFLFALYSLF